MGRTSAPPDALIRTAGIFRPGPGRPLTVRSTRQPKACLDRRSQQSSTFEGAAPEGRTLEEFVRDGEGPLPQPEDVVWCDVNR